MVSLGHRFLAASLGLLLSGLGIIRGYQKINYL